MLPCCHVAQFVISLFKSWNIVFSLNYEFISNTDGLSSSSTNSYRPWRSIHELPSDTYGRRGMANVQSSFNFSGNFHDQKPVDYSLMTSNLTPQHHHAYSSSPQFDEVCFVCILDKIVQSYPITICRFTIKF